MRIGIYDDDRYYLNRVCEIMNAKYLNDLFFVPLDKEQINDAVKSADFDMCILPGYMNNIAKPDITVMYSREDDVCDANNTLEFYKYMNTSEMYIAVNDAYTHAQKVRAEAVSREREKEAVVQEEAHRAAEENVRVEIKKELKDEIYAKVNTFVSLGGGMGSSTVAAGAARYFAGLGRKVLYVNMKAFAGGGYFDGKCEIVSISDVLMKSISGLGKEIVNNITKVDNLYVIGSFNEYGRLKDISKKDVLKLIEEFDRIGQFDDIVFDTYMDNSAVSEMLMDISANICCVVDDSVFGKFRLMNMLDSIKGSGANEKVKVIFNKYKKMPRVDESIDDLVIGGIGYNKGENPLEIVQQISGMNFLEVLVK